MSKLGRYSADRKKIKNLACGQTVGADGADTNVTSDIEAEECGTVFTLTPPAAADKGGATITLPTVAAAGKGWWCKMILLADIPADTNNNDVNDIIVQGDAGDDNDMIVSQQGGGANDAAVSAVNGGTLTFKENVAKAGDQVEIICDGDTFLVHSMAAVVGGIVKG